jgi:hypothetical protein
MAGIVVALAAIREELNCPAVDHSDAALKIILNPLELAAQLGRHPDIILVQEGNPFAPGLTQR